MKKNWEDAAWDEYLHWQNHDKTKVRKINELLKDIERHPFEGIGKPEPLKFNFRGCWSRHIDEEHRLVYRIVGGTQIDIVCCLGHYE
jgi:toxin YoeB